MKRRNARSLSKKSKKSAKAENKLESPDYIRAVKINWSVVSKFAPDAQRHAAALYGSINQLVGVHTALIKMRETLNKNNAEAVTQAAAVIEVRIDSKIQHTNKLLDAYEVEAYEAKKAARKRKAKKSKRKSNVLKFRRAKAKSRKPRKSKIARAEAGQRAAKRAA